MTMPKQTTKLPAYYFFDEMQEKMQEDNKRRKLSKKAVNSQPELSFLQFDPNKKEALGSSSNKYHSQPCDSNKYKTPWRPPRMVLKEPDTPSDLDNRQSLSNKQIMEGGTENCNLLSVNSFAEDRLKLTKSNSSDGRSIIEDTRSNYVSLLNEHFDRTSQEDEKEKISADTDFTHTEKIPKVIVENNDSCCITNSDARDEQPRDTSSNSGQNLIEHNNSSATICGSGFDIKCSKVNSSNENADIIVNDCLEEVSHMVSSQESASDDQISQKIERELTTDRKSGGEHSISESDRIRDFENLFTQGNPKFVETSTLLEDQNNELEVNKERKDYSEHEDILNSIEMILSEGQNNNSENDIKEVGKEETEESANQMLIDSVFDTSCISKNANGVPQDLNIDESSFCNVGEQSIKECPLNPSIEYPTVETTVSQLNNLSKEEINVLEKEPFSKSLDDKNDTDVFVKEDCSKMYQCKTKKNLDGVEDEIEMEKGEEENINMAEDREDMALDDDYSCLMISNSQLLEIEKKYYEAPQSAGLLNDLKPLVKEKTPSNVLSAKEECNQRNISVATQTELFYSNLSATNPPQRNLPHQVLTVKWPNKVQETQRQLRETIQEISRLNSVLLKVRQQIWPQRNTESGPGPSSRDNTGNSSWQNK